MAHPRHEDLEPDDIDESTPEADTALEDATANVSAWGISITVHVVALLLLVTVVFMGQMPQERPVLRPVTIEVPDPIEPEDRERALVDRPVPDELEAEVEEDHLVLDPVDFEIVEIDIDSEEISEATDSNEISDAVSQSQTGATAAFAAIGADAGGSNAFQRPGPTGRARIGGPRGSTKASEDAVERALRWFAWHQSPNGQWDVDGYQINCDRDRLRCEPGRAHTGADGDVACTGYALLCYLGAGYDHHTANKYRKVVRNGVDWLVAQQDAEGSLGARNYEHAIAAMALIEAYGMTNDPTLRDPAQRAVDVILARQTVDGDGYRLGWDYSKPKPARQDSSITGWNVMALKSAQVSGLDVGQGMAGARRWLEGAWQAANPDHAAIDAYQDESLFPYTWNAVTGETKGESRAPMGAVCAVFLGSRQGEPMLESLATYIMNHQVPESYPCNTYYLYYNSMAIFQLGDEDKWAVWNDRVRDMLVGAQRREGCFDGSWDWEGTGFHGHDTGRLLSTAYNTLCLEVYYRYLPLAARR